MSTSKLDPISYDQIDIENIQGKTLPSVNAVDSLQSDISNLETNILSLNSIFNSNMRVFSGSQPTGKKWKAWFKTQS